MNILVINISLRPKSPVKLFPVGLGYVTTAMKRDGVLFDLIDIDGHRYTERQLDTLIQKKKYDVVCMGCIVTGYKLVKDLAAKIRQYHPYAVIVVGNSVASSITDTLLNNTEADVAVIGEGDETVVDLLAKIRNSESLYEVTGIAFLDKGRVVKTQPRPLIKDISILPFIDFEIFDVDIYIEGSKNYVSDPLPFPRDQVRALPVNTARGCIADCGFCYHVFKGVPYRFRSADSIVAEIKEITNKYDLNVIQFWDELTFFSKKHSEDLVNRMLEEGLQTCWTASCRANLFDNESDMELIHKMKQAGCRGLSYSLESADPEILKAMNKHITVKDFTYQTALLRRGGLSVWTSLVIGYPQETPMTIKKTFDCCIENQIYPSAGFLLPQPGSAVYDYSKERGYIVEEEDYLMKLGDRQDLRINLTSMSDEQLEHEVKEGLKRCNEALGTGLKETELIKTQYYRAHNEVSQLDPVQPIPLDKSRQE